MRSGDSVEAAREDIFIYRQRELYKEDRDRERERGLKVTLGKLMHCRHNFYKGNLASVPGKKRNKEGVFPQKKG